MLTVHLLERQQLSADRDNFNLEPEEACLCESLPRDSGLGRSSNDRALPQLSCAPTAQSVLEKLHLHATFRV